MKNIFAKFGLRKAQKEESKEFTENKSVKAEKSGNVLADGVITQSLNVYAALSSDNQVRIYFGSKYFGVMREEILPDGATAMVDCQMVNMSGKKVRKFIRTINGKTEYLGNSEMDSFKNYFIAHNIPAELYFSTVGLDMDLVSRGWRTCVYRISLTEFNKLSAEQKKFVSGLQGGDKLGADIQKMIVMAQQRNVVR